LASDAVPLLPAYTVPATPVELKGEPLAEAEGGVWLVALEEPQVVRGAPGWPGPFGLGVASTNVAAESNDCG